MTDAASGDDTPRDLPPPLPVGATIGILGGGQLGRMLSVAAARLGFTSHIFEPGANPPAGHVADRVTTAPYDDADALRAFAGNVDVITYEFENIPADALDLLEALKPVRPSRAALWSSQDRLVEKGFLEGLGLATAPYGAVCNALDLAAALESIGTPAILKTRRLGYDGKGQARIARHEDAAAALAAMDGADAVLEGFVDFAFEASVIAARGLDGTVMCYEPGQNVHEAGILATTTVPARLTDRQRKQAFDAANAILDALDYVGVMGIELFVQGDGLVVNEIAPRVHNSGHWTQNGCIVDQFEQHIRAVAGWPLGDGARHSDVVMTNLIGNDMDKVPTLAADPANALHLYGKRDVRPGRKMGHINRVTGAATACP